MTAPAPGAAAGGADLAADFARCREVVRLRARNFYHGLRLTPEPRRSALFAVYAWMRLGDDIVDDAAPAADRRARLEVFAARTQALLAGGEAAPQEPAVGDPPWALSMWRAFGRALREHPIVPADIEAMLQGLAADLAPQRMASWRELERYCDRVASSVGRVCVRVWGVRRGASMERALALASQRGLAFQLTNILRDFAEDAAAGRRYLPDELFAAHALGHEDLLRWRDPGRCAALVREAAGRAAAGYEASAPLDALVDPACAPTLTAMTGVYRALLERIVRTPRLAAGPQRARVPAVRKAGIALRAVMAARWARAR